MWWLHNSKNKLKIIESHTLKGSIFWYMNYIIYFLNYILIKLFFSKKKYFAWEKNSLETWDPWRQRELLEEAFDNVKYCIKVKFIRNYFFFHPNYIFTLYVNKSKAIILWCTHPQVCYQSACSYYNYLSPLGIRQPKLFLSTMIPHFYHFSKDLSQQKHLKQMLTEETHEGTHFQRTTKDIDGIWCNASYWESLLYLAYLFIH